MCKEGDLPQIHALWIVTLSHSRPDCTVQSSVSLWCTNWQIMNMHSHVPF